MIPVSSTKTFVQNVDDIMLTVDIAVEVPGVNFKRKDSRTMEVFVVNSATGLREKLPDSVHQVGSKITMKVSEWLNLAGGVSLDDHADWVHQPESVGIARLRIVGLGLVLHLEVTNSASDDMFTFPSSKIQLLIHSKHEDNWHRQTLPARPTAVRGQQLIRDAYGMRIRTETMPSRVAVFNLRYVASSVFDIVIFFNITNVAIRLFAMFALGRTSTRWRNSVGKHIDDHTVMSLEVKRVVGLRERHKEQDREVLRKVGLELLKMVDPDCRLRGQKDSIARAVMTLIDNDHNGVVGILELEDLLEKIDVAGKDEHTATHLFWAMDLDGTGKLSPMEVGRLVAEAVHSEDENQCSGGGDGDGNESRFKSSIKSNSNNKNITVVPCRTSSDVDVKTWA